MVADGRPAQRPSPSQSYARGSTTTLFIAVGGVVAGCAGGLAAVALRNGDGAAVRIEQDFVGIEAQAARGVERPVDAIGIDLAGCDAGHEDVPVVIGAVGYGIERDDARRAARRPRDRTAAARSAQRFGEHAEVDAAVGKGRAQRRTSAVPRCRTKVGQGASAVGDSCTAFQSFASDTGMAPPSRCSAAYSAIVRSLENLPELATFRIALRAHASRIGVQARSAAGRPPGRTRKSARCM